MNNSTNLPKISLKVFIRTFVLTEKDIARYLGLIHFLKLFSIKNEIFIICVFNNLPYHDFLKNNLFLYK